MKKTAASILFFAFCLARLSAQNPGCDGIRYKSDVFSGVQKSTVQYATAINQVNAQVNLMMDVYQPAGDNISVRPVVILAHGGSFMFGDKMDMKRWCELLAKKGYVAASVDYRLFPVFPLGLPDSTEIFDTAVKAVGDMKCAVRFFREDAATANTFRADPDNIFIGGYSAGAVTALHAGFLDSNDVLPPFIQNIINSNGGLDGNTGTASNQTYSPSVKAVVSMSGGMYRSFWVDADDIPVTSIHGDHDGTVPYTSGLAANIAYLEGSSLIHQAADAAGLLNALVTVPGGDHTDIYDPGKAQFVPYVDSFWVNTTTILEYLVCQTTDVHHAQSETENWQIYPNPAKAGEILTVALPETVRRASFVLTDASGKTVLLADDLQKPGTIRPGSLPAGIYTVQMRDADKPSRHFSAKKLVLTH